MDNHSTHGIKGGPERLVVRSALMKDLARMASHADKQYSGEVESTPSTTLAAVTAGWKEGYYLTKSQGAALRTWLDSISVYVDETNETEEARHDRLVEISSRPAAHDEVLRILDGRVPVFVLFNNYFRVRPLIHLQHLTDRVDTTAR